MHLWLWERHGLRKESRYLEICSSDWGAFIQTDFQLEGLNLNFINSHFQIYANISSWLSQLLFPSYWLYIHVLSWFNYLKSWKNNLLMSFAFRPFSIHFWLFFIFSNFFIGFSNDLPVGVFSSKKYPFYFILSLTLLDILFLPNVSLCTSSFGPSKLLPWAVKNVPSS